MEEPKKTCNDQEKNKMVIKMGGGVGGGIGAVVLLGGALVTAALASAFLVRKKGWNSSKDRRRRRHQNPPPEFNKQNEPDEINKEQQFIVLDTSSHVDKHPSGAAKEVESGKDTGLLVSTQSLTLDEKPGIEINGGTTDDIYDVEASEEILCSITPKQLENDPISDGSVIIKEDFRSLDEKLPFELKNAIQEVHTQLTKEEVSNEISKESHNFEQVHIEEERAERESDSYGEVEGINDKESVEITEMQPREEENTEVCCDQEENEITAVDNAVEGVHIDHVEAQKNEITKVNIEEKDLEGCCSEDGEISEEKCDVAIEKTEDDLAAIGSALSEEGICGNQEAVGIDSSLSETIVSESHSEDGQKTIQPMFDNPVIEHKNVNGDAEEGALAVEIVEITQVDEDIEGDQEDPAKHIEEQLVKEHEKCDQPDGGTIPEKSDPQIEVNEEEILCENKEENACTGNPILENGQFGVPMLKEELISAEDIEVAKEDGANEEIAESLEVNENETSVQLLVCQPNDNDVENGTNEEVEEEMISLEDTDLTKEDGKNEEVAENLETNENKTPVKFVVCQPKDDEDDAGRNITQEVEELSETIDTGIVTAKDDQIMEMSEDEEKGEANIKDFDDETDLSDEVEESTEGSGDSSKESNSEAVWPAESLQELSTEPQQDKLIDQEVEGKIQEDKTVEEREHNSQDNEITSGDSSFGLHQVTAEDCNSQKSSDNFPTMADSSQFPDGKGNSEKSFIEKYVVEPPILKEHLTNSIRRKMLIGTLSVLSSLSCSWFFGLSFDKLCLIVFLTMVLSGIHGY